MKRIHAFLIIILVTVTAISMAVADQVSYDNQRQLLTVECNHVGENRTVSLIVVRGQRNSYTVKPETIYYLRQLKAGNDGLISISIIANLTEDYVFLLGGATEDADLHVAGSFSLNEMEKLSLPSSLNQIMDEAFMGDESLKTVLIKSGVKSIGDRAFKDCSNLIYIEIPGTVKEIGENAFAGCEGITIGCSADSRAYEYAAENNLPVHLLGE